MAIRISCPCCAARLRVRDSSTGKTARCPLCTTHFVVGSQSVRVTKPTHALKPEARPDDSSSRGSAGGHATRKPIFVWTGVALIAALSLGGSVVLLKSGQRPDDYALSTEPDSKPKSTPPTNPKTDPEPPKPIPPPDVPEPKPIPPNKELRLPGANGPRIEQIGEPGPGISVVSMFVCSSFQEWLDSGDKGLPKVFPSGTKKLAIVVGFTRPPPDGTKVDYEIYSNLGPMAVREKVVESRLNKATGSYMGEMRFQPAGEVFPDGEYQARVRFDGQPIALLNGSVGNEKKATLPSDGNSDIDLQGKWKLYAYHDHNASGKKNYLLITSPKEYLIIKDNEITTQVDEGGTKTSEFKVSFQLEPNRNPKLIKKTIVEGDGKGKSHSAIYKIDGDTLMICAQADGEAPESFTVQKNDGKNRYILEYKRVNP
jgi:uncharacterized protein (TIGR03067 family)